MENCQVPLVRVFSNVSLNPACVGKTEVVPVLANGNRTTATTVYDATGQHILLRVETVVSTGSSELASHNVERDNFIHAEIRAALHECRDARQWVDSAALAPTA
jgi:hypothetical protein